MIFFSNRRREPGICHDSTLRQPRSKRKTQQSRKNTLNTARGTTAIHA